MFKVVQVTPIILEASLHRSYQLLSYFKRELHFEIMEQLFLSHLQTSPLAHNLCSLIPIRLQNSPLTWNWTDNAPMQLILTAWLSHSFDALPLDLSAVFDSINSNNPSKDLHQKPLPISQRCWIFRKQEIVVLNIRSVVRKNIPRPYMYVIIIIKHTFLSRQTNMSYHEDVCSENIPNKNENTKKNRCY